MPSAYAGMHRTTAVTWVAQEARRLMAFTPPNPTDAYIDGQRYGALLVLAQFVVYQNGSPVGGPYTANVSDGSFTIDRNSEFRRTGQITLEFNPLDLPGELVPTNPSSLLAPFGTELLIWTGLSTPADAVSGNAAQLIPNGLFVITSTTVDDLTVDLQVTLSLSDRGWTIAQRTLKSPYNFPATANGNFADEMIALINLVWNQQQNVQPLQFNIVPTAATVPTASYDQGSDPWQACQDMAAAVGYELYFDQNGVVVGKPIPDFTQTQPIWNFTDDATVISGNPVGSGSTALQGGPYSTPAEASVTMTRDGIYNDIIIQGTGDANAATYKNGIQTSGSPILAEAADLNAFSPTFVGGPMGDVPNFIS